MTEQDSKKLRVLKLLMLLLAAATLVAAWGFTTLKDTGSQNSVQNLCAEEEADENRADILEENVPDREAVMTEGAAALANPIHHCTQEADGTDYTDFSYVYFGSYPQSEVTDQTIIAAIDSAIEAGDAAAGADTAATGDKETGDIDAAAVKAVDSMFWILLSRLIGIDADTVEKAGTDVELDGTKYRRISNGNWDNFNLSGDAENNGYCYFKWEPIKWRVLDKDDNGTLFVMADSALDCKTYNVKYANVTWEKSTIRSWLNDSFYQMAFSSAEQSAVTPWHVVNEDNPDYDVKGGNDTTDHVYLLSIGEVTKEKYGFCSDYCKESASRQLQISDYAYARGAWRNSDGEYEGDCWLRSPGEYSDLAALVYCDGYVGILGETVHTYDFGVVPVLHIDLLSDLWSVADDSISGEGDGN